MFFIEGFFIGLATLFVVGSVALILINATFKNGIKSGIAVAIGIMLGDLIYAVLAHKGLKTIIDSPFLTKYIGIIGFVILFVFGILSIFKKQAVNDTTIVSNKTHFTNFIKGFSVNFFNPFVLGFWILLSKYGKDKYAENSLYFLLAIVFGVLVIDFAKVFLAKRLLPLIKSNKMTLFNKISGVVLLLFSFRILYEVLMK
ncbi:MAG: LysE family transporter [Flavobacteriaceae bacterium]